MARTSRAEKARTRQRLVAGASREFRANGVTGTSIPGVMERVGLTQGTFYAHFASKEALLAEAVGAGLAEMVDGLLGAPTREPPTRDLAGIIDHYLDAGHRDDPAGGCVLPALAGELRRESAAVRRAFTAGLEDFFDRVAPLLPGDSIEARIDDAIALIAGMAGAILLARGVDDPALSDRILRACRGSITTSFVSQAGGEATSALAHE